VIGLQRAWLRHVPSTPGAAALATRLDRAFAARPRRRTVRTDVGRCEVDTADLVDRYLYLFGCWEPHLSRWLPTRLGPGDVFVDVGAYTGWFSRVAAAAGADVVACEPSPEAVEVLRRHVAGLPVRVEHTAVGAGGGVRAFGLPDAGTRGGASAALTGAVAFTTPVRPLGEVLDDDEVARVRVVKIDVEGDEADVVDTLVPLLGKMRDDVEIAVEVAPDRLAARGRTVDDVLAPLREAGFGVWRIPNDYRASSYPAQRRRSVAPRPPVPFDGPFDVQHDLVLSRQRPDRTRD
jgi:FkbM family methyltransferase